jgi:RNA methyltransferase, TrmH family
MERAYEPPGRPGSTVRRPDARGLDVDADVDADADAGVDAAVDAVRRGRGAPDRVVLEGVHALKHAVRFGADLEVVVTPDAERLTRLLAELAPDVALPEVTVQLPRPRWRELVAHELPSPALSIARRPPVDLATVLAAPGRIVVLEDPRHLGNLGAAVRVAAAADAAGVLVLGDADPWHPTAVRAAAGLHLAVPVVSTSLAALLEHRGGRPLVALDPDGGDLTGGLPADAVLLVGTERAGLSSATLAAADLRVRLPMRQGVSSLNLATAVAVALYAGVSGPGPQR